ncbi:DNA polymerase III subunit beta [Alphaproteobacteria bacterium]|nr:DNA polymerase III subunit beta [Alphaproteobacteria bacterium]
MKFTIERNVLAKSLAHMQNIVERRPTVAIMSNVKLALSSDAEGDWLNMSATNSEIELIERLPVKIAEAGDLTASCLKLHDVVRKIPDGVQIECALGGKGQLQLAAGRAKFSLPTLPSADFYNMPEGDLPGKFTIPVAVMKSIIGKTMFAAALDEVKHYFNSIYLFSQQKDGKNWLMAAATDGHRLAATAQELPADAKEIAGIIVPRKTIQELNRLLDDAASEDMAVEVSPTQIRFTMAGVVMNSRLIDATYPEYERVIPPLADKVAEINSDDFHQVVERVAVFAEKSSRIKISFSKDKLVLGASSSDEGSAEEDLEISYDGPNFETYFNYRYLLDIVAQTRGGRIKCSVQDTLSPALFMSDKDEQSRYILMPMLV